MFSTYMTTGHFSHHNFNIGELVCSTWIRYL